MPELPEVEAARRALQAVCAGRRIKRCTVARDSVVIPDVSPLRLESALVGRSILEARRKGKNLWLRLDEPPFPSFQFGMSGAIYIKGIPVTNYKRSAVLPTDDWPSKYSKVFVELDDGIEFSFTDKRRFARIRLLDDPESMPPISELGPDALFEPMQLSDFIDSLGQRKTGIKALLLDQSFLSGIGNWIADEVLYQARLHPLQIAANLSKEGCESLHRSINEVIKHAVEVDADSSRFPSDWLFHVRWGKKPGDVDGKKIEFITAGGRTTAYVPELQKLMRTQLNENTTPKSKRGSRDRTESGISAAETKKNKNNDIGKKDTNVSKKQAKSKVKVDQTEGFNGDIVNATSKTRAETRAEVAVKRNARQKKKPIN